MTAMEELAVITAELELRAADPLKGALAGLTLRQLGWLKAPQRVRLLDGGNRSGKTWTNVVDFLAQALGVHPTRPWKAGLKGEKTWLGWYSAVSYEMFGLMAWMHFKRMLLFPGEREMLLPTRRILAMGWNKKNPQIPDFLRLRRADGLTAEIWIKSYEQGAGAFQSGGVDTLALDEECGQDIYDESRLRIVEREGGLTVSATPVQGEPWLEDLRTQAELGQGVAHARLPMSENPAVPKAELEDLRRSLENRPDELALRLEGIPKVLQGRILGDQLFTRQHLIKPFTPPRDWTRYRCIDPGVNVCACLWAAVAPGRKKIVFYKEHYGENITPVIDGNAQAILALSKEDGGEAAFAGRWIDPAAIGRTAESGERMIDLFNRCGYCKQCGARQGTGTSGQGSGECKQPGCYGRVETLRLTPAPDNRVLETINLVQQLMAEKGPDGYPLIGVCQHLRHFLEERRAWEWEPANTTTDQVREKRKANHLMACLRYLVGAGLEHKPRARALPPEGTLGRRLVEKRRQHED